MLRLYSYLKCYAGLSKKELNDAYQNNLIKVDGKQINLSHLVRPNEIVTLNDKVIKPIENVYYIYNKPSDLLCVYDLDNPKSIYNHLNIDYKVFSVGRLDKDTTGLLILTNDGKFSDYVLSKDSHIDKEYEVKLKQKITNDFLEKIEKSYNLRGKYTIPAKIVSYSDFTINLILYEGMYHQVKRIVKESGNCVKELRRVRIGHLLLDDLKIGDVKKIDNIKDII